MMRGCPCCGYNGKARVEYLEMLKPLQARIAHQRKELVRINKLLLTSNKALYQAQEAAKLATIDTAQKVCGKVLSTFCGVVFCGVALRCGKPHNHDGMCRP